MRESSIETLHACSVAWGARGLLITGPSGSGKSSLTLQLMALGCTLVADDRTNVFVRGEQLIARCPEPIVGQIEARGFGILRADTLPETTICAIADLSQTESHRLPLPQTRVIQGIVLRQFHKCANEVFPFALLQYLKTGMQDESLSDD